VLSHTTYLFFATLSESVVHAVIRLYLSPCIYAHLCLYLYLYVYCMYEYICVCLQPKADKYWPEQKEREYIGFIVSVHEAKREVKEGIVLRVFNIRKTVSAFAK